MRPALALALATAVACSRPAAPEARTPSAEGVVADVGPDRIALDGARSFRLSEDVASFTAAAHAPTPVARWRGTYVQVGLNASGRVEWIAGIGVVQPDGRTVYYTGTVLRASGGRVTFRDGTVLRVAPGVRAPPRGARVLVTIDARDARATSLRRA